MRRVLFAAVLAAAVTAWGQEIPRFAMDEAIRYGKLDNGLTYYIRHNEEPRDRANFYIAQKVGSVQEDDSQRGLAHFLEHMCFNGTKHFPGNGIVEYCESIGVKYGRDLNAYTAADETVYNIDGVPTTQRTNIDTCLLILSDWADGLLLETEEIEKERGGIREEWRLRSGATMRILERNLPALYPGSKYGERMPIGTMEVIDTFDPDTLRAYYEKWYRPDLQGIVVVGDVDVDYVEMKIRELFGDIAMPADAAVYETYPVPSNDEPVYVIDKDKEQQANTVELIFKHERMPEALRETHALMIENYITSAAAMCLNARLDELAQTADCPFLSAGSGYGSYLMSRTMDAFEVWLMPKDGRDAEAVRAVMEEIERAKRYGFTAGEVTRARDELVSRFERIYDNRDKHKSIDYAKEYVRHFLDGDYIPGIEREFTAYKQYASMLGEDVVSATFAQMTANTDTDFVCIAMYMDKEGVTMPSADVLRQAVESARTADLEAYVDNVRDEPLVPALPERVLIASECAAPYGYTCWTLGNGARVYWRRTDFDDAMVYMAARSIGGTNALAVSDLPNADLLTLVMTSTGLGTFSAVELEKKLAGKQASVTPSIDMVTDRLDGESTTKDLRTLFEMIYLRFQEPGVDVEGYNNTIATLRASLANIVKSPAAAFTDSLHKTLYGHAERAGSVIPDAEKADYDVIRRIYRDRFASAGDFDFFFTGAFDPDSLRLLTEQLIAPLPATDRRETLTDCGLRPVTGVVTNTFTREMETPKAAIAQVWTGVTAYSDKTAAVCAALGAILTQRYIKSIREEGSMAYSVGARADADYKLYDSYELTIQCPVKPEKADSALALIQEGLASIAAHGVTDGELADVREYSVKSYTDNLRKNIYWQNKIVTYVVWGKDTHSGALDAINSVSSDDIQSFVRDCILAQRNCVTVTMLPE